MTAGLLHILGVDMGNIRDPDAQNPRGYFEDEDFLHVGDRIYRAADPQATGFSPPPLQTILAKGKGFDDEIRSLVQSRLRSTRSQVWGWKAIHTALTIGLFLPYLERPHFVVVVRDPLEIARSSVEFTRYKAGMYREMTLLGGLQLSNFYYHHIYTFLEKHPELPRLFISFDDVLEDPDAALRALGAFLALEVRSVQSAEALAFVASRDRMRWEKERARMVAFLRSLKARLRRLLG